MKLSYLISCLALLDIPGTARANLALNADGGDGFKLIKRQDYYSSPKARENVERSNGKTRHTINKHPIAKNGKPAGFICTVTSTVTRIITRTSSVTRAAVPPIATSIVIETITQTSNLDPRTSTFRSTSTLFRFSRVTETIIETSTEFATFTSGLTTITIPAPAGFTPIKSVYPPTIAPPKRDLSPRKNQPPKDNGYPVRPGDYRECSSKVTTTITHKRTRIVTSTVIALGPTARATNTITVTSLSLILPNPVSTTRTLFSRSTLSLTSILTSTTVITSTSTTTASSNDPAVNFYAACGPDNILTEYQGKYISTVIYGSPGGFNLGPATTSYECCVACLLDSNCADSHFIGDGFCYGSPPAVGTCDGSLVSGFFIADFDSPTDWSVSNGGCGQWELS